MILKQSLFAFHFTAFAVASECFSFTSAFTLHKSQSPSTRDRLRESFVSNEKEKNVVMNNNIYSANFKARSFVRNAKSESDTKDGNSVKDMNPLTRASWYAVEAFGKIFGDGAKTDSKEDLSESVGEVGVDLTRAPLSMEEALVRIRMDNDRSYFLSGEVDKLAYEEECIFSDPFVSFAGRDRFIDNLSNLGSFITEYDAKMLKYDVLNEDQTQVLTKVMVKLELNLPWKPILAWPWGVTYNIDKDTFLIKSHAESWDIEPFEGVKQIFRKPTTRINK